MANNQNNETANTAGFVALAGVCVILGFGLIVVAFAMFLTLLAICAQFRPITFQGNTLTAKEGRKFILFGLTGMLPCAMLLAQIALWLNIEDLEPKWTWALLLLGYSISALAITWFIETFWSTPEATKQPDVVIPVAPAQLQQPVPLKPYEFAEWSDEDHPYK